MTDAVAYELEVHRTELQLQNEELLRALQDLETERDRYRALYEETPIGYLTLNARGCVIEANAMARAMLGLQHARAESPPLQRYLTQASADELHRYLQTLVLECETPGCVLHTKSMERVLRLVAMRASLTEATATPQYRCALIDETRLARTRESLEKSTRQTALAENRAESEAALLMRVMDVAPLLMLVIDEEGRILHLNSFAEEMLGCALAEAKGRDAIPMLAAETERRKARARLQAAFRGEPLRAERQKIVAHDGTERTVLCQSHVLPPRDGWPLALLFTGIDVTESDALEATMRRSETMEATGRLATGIAHDFNNVLMGIAGTVDVVRSVVTGEQAHVLLDDICGATESAAAFVRRLLGKGQDSQTPSALDETVGHQVPFLRRLVGEEIELVVTLEAPEARVPLGAGSLNQALLNLVVNAREAMPGGGKLGIATHWEEVDAQKSAPHPWAAPGRYAVLTVQDSGAGMDARTLRHLFEPYFTTKDEKGTGIGLTTLHTLLRANRGFVEVESVPGEGTTMRVYLPPVAADANAPVVRTPAIGAPPAPRAATVLVVEDDTLVRRSVCFYLERLGHRPVAAADAAEGIRAVQARGEEIDVVLSDAVLPGEYGMQDLVRELDALWPGTPVVCMSAYSPQVLVEQGRLPADAWALMKPFSQEQLDACLSEILRAAPPGRA